MSRAFTRHLLLWYDRAHRDLPWRRTRDPYAIWISEIMLQQTRVSAVIPYYERFLQRFPTVDALAAAPEEELLRAWAGLGYYSRARNLQKAAVLIGSAFPGDYETIRTLPGIGDYTAAAVASIAFNLPHAAVDGNVLRVLSRVTSDPGDIGSPSTRRRIGEVAQDLLDPARPGAFNQAMMELGATVCLPRDPQCLLCPVSGMCTAYQTGKQQELPIKLRRSQQVKVNRTLFVIERDGDILFWQRPASSRKLQGFWELPEPEHLKSAVSHRCVGQFRHSITNHNYSFDVWEATIAETPDGFQWLSASHRETAPLSTTARKALAVRSLESSRHG